MDPNNELLVGVSGEVAGIPLYQEKKLTELPAEPVELQDFNAFSSPESTQNGASSSPGVMRKLLKPIQYLVPSGGLIANCFQLGSVTLGGGIISMPDSFRTSGIIMAIIYLVVMCVVTVYSMTQMGYVMRLTHLENFEYTGQALFGRLGGFFVGLVICVCCLGGAIGYISAAGSLVRPFLYLSPNTPEYWKSDNGVRLIQTLIWLVFLLPVSIPKHLNSVRYIAVAGVCFVLYFVVVIIVHSCTNGLQKGMRDGIVFFTTGNQAIYGMSIFIFSFLCQGISYPIYYEMKPKSSITQLTVASAISMSVCTLFYILVGVFGYFDFAGAVMPSILDNYDPLHTPYVFVAYIGMLIKIIAAFCVNWIPIRNFFYYCLRWELATTPYWKHTLFCVVLSGLLLVAGLFIPNVTVAFGLVGALTGGFMGFIFPSLFWMYCGNWSLKTVGIWHWLATQAMLIAGVVAVIWGTIATIYGQFFSG